MTICNMSIEGGARVGYVNPDETTFDYLRGRPFAPQGDAFERASAWWRRMASDPRRAVRRRSRDRRGGDPPDRDVGHQSGTVGRRRRATAGCRRLRRADRAIAEALDVHGLRRPGSRSRGRRSTSRSSARARTRGSPTCARPRASSAASTSRRTSRRSSCRDRRRCARRPSAKASTACSSTPASNGAAPAARCAWR